ncbi:hypothetical protein KKA66_02755 [Patescibacteria group bacterium]|nr:hypothetical protein [Patescibacteria group bacterium]
MHKYFQNKNIPYITIPLMIAAFIFLGIFIFNFSGITNLVSNESPGCWAQETEI